MTHKIKNILFVVEHKFCLGSKKIYNFQSNQNIKKINIEITYIMFSLIIDLTEYYIDL